MQCNPLHLRWINGLLSALAHIFVISHRDGGLMMFCWNGDGLFGWFYCYNRHQEHKIGVWRVQGWIVSSLLRTDVVPKTKQPCMTDGGDADLRWPFLGNIQEALMDYLLDAHCLLEIDSWMMDLRESASFRSPRVAFFWKLLRKEIQRYTTSTRIM